MLSIALESDHSQYGTDSLQSKWDEIKKKIILSLSDDSTINWIDSLAPIENDAGVITLGAPTRFARDWIKNNLQKNILSVWKQSDPSIISLDIIVGRKKSLSVSGKKEKKNLSDTIKINPQSKLDLSDNSKILPPTKKTPTPSPKQQKTSPSSEVTAPHALDDMLDEKYTFENFITGPSNELAYAAARKIADGKSVSFNPLFLYGGVGLGKTHLMHAIALYIKENRPHCRAVYLSAEQFMYQFVNALRNYDMQKFKDEFRSLDILLIDDLQFISGKNSTQEEFFHTFNALVDSKKQIVLSADRPPNDINNMEERIRSRLSWGLVADIHQTDYSLRLGIIHSKIELLQKEYPSFFVPDKVVEYLSHYITGNIRELEGAVNRIAAHATFTGRPVTIDTVEQIINDLIKMYEKRISVSEIQRIISEFFNIKINDLKSARRSREIVRPRQMAMYLCKNMTGLSFPEIGRKFGGKDHTTVLHSVRRVEELMSENNEISEQISELKTLIKTRK